MLKYLKPHIFHLLQRLMEYKSDILTMENGVRNAGPKRERRKEESGDKNYKAESDVESLERGIRSLIEVRDESAHAMEEAPEWEELDFMVDSGASETVANEGMIKAVTTTEGKTGVRYQLADGSYIENAGQKMSQ